MTMPPIERREAFERLFRSTRTELLLYLLRRSTNPEDAADVTLASSEACANAMEHPRSAVAPAIEIQGHIRAAEVEVIVRDFGSWSAGAGEGNRGRGLQMIRELMDDVSVARDERGTIVTMRRGFRGGGLQAGRPEIATRT